MTNYKKKLKSDFDGFKDNFVHTLLTVVSYPHSPNTHKTIGNNQEVDVSKLIEY